MDLQERLQEEVGRLQTEVIRLIADLVRIPSENTPPTGGELACQEFVASYLRELDLEVDLYPLESISGLDRHPVFHPGRNYSNRPNLAGVLRGEGGGRSLLLSGHIDTVPRGSAQWCHDPFGAEIDGNCLYGLGANDMKAGVAVILMTLRVLRELGITLSGDLLVETVVDEEFGGANGTLAGRLKGHNASAAIICEPSHESICPAMRGGRTAHITLRGNAGGILFLGNSGARAIDQLGYLLGRIREFADRRLREVRVHPLYEGNADPVPVWVTKVSTGEWGMREPVSVPDKCRVEVYWQAMPGESKEEIDSEFFAWLDEIVTARPDLFPYKPQVDFPIRWLPGSAISPEEPLVKNLGESFRAITGQAPIVAGINGACDMFVMHQCFNTPAVLFGPSGDNIHAPDESVELDSVARTLATLVDFVTRWCGVANDK